jgi:CBS domain containing-hemolysin-like protein
VKSTSSSQKRAIVTTLVLVALVAPLAALSPWILSVLLIATCGVYVSFEFALVKMPMSKLERDVKSGVAGAGHLLAMKREMNAMLAACQFGITLTSLGLTLALEPAIHDSLVGYQDLAEYSTAMAMTIGAFFHVTFGELVPKSLALVVPGKVLYLTAPFMRIFRFLAVPFIKTCNTIANVAVQMLTGKNPDTQTHHDEGVEIGQALVYAHASGEIKPQQLQLMRNVLSFADRTAREVMTPARLVVTLDLRRTWEENTRIADEHGFSRLPVTDGDPHNVVGYARRAEILKAEIHGLRDLAALVQPIEKRLETTALTRLNLFQGSPMLALYDEHDSFTGLLTAEDLVEQIVGEIYDDTDEPAAPEQISLEDGKLRISGAMLLGSVAELLAAPELANHEDIDTIGGLVGKKLGRMPRTGDEVDLGAHFATIEASKGFRVLSLIVRPKPAPAAKA